jgi:hypothetical protein
MRPLKTLALLSVLLLLPTAGHAKPTPQASRYVSLLIQDIGGFTPIEYAFSRTPAVLYSDGLLIVPQRIQTLQYPGQFVTGFQQKRDLASVPRFLAAAQKLHLTDPKFDWGRTWIVDVPDTVFITQISQKAPQTRMSVYALGFDGDVTPKSKLDARRAASKFRDKVESFSSEFMWTKSRPTVWKPTKWLYMATAESSKDPMMNLHKWVGSHPLKMTFACKAMTDAENTKFNSLLPKLNQASRFSSGGKIWRVTVRPLFPHETGCQSIIN